MNDLITERMPLVIAVEVNTIIHQTKKVVLNNAIEIGRRLREAKDLIPYGEWGKWLAESISYSERTKTKHLRLKISGRKGEERNKLPLSLRE